MKKHILSSLSDAQIYALFPPNRNNEDLYFQSIGEMIDETPIFNPSRHPR